MFLGLMVLGLAVGFAVRATRHGAHVNPGMVATGVVLLPMMALSIVRAVGASGDPEGVGYALGYTVGSALIPLVIASMIWFFMRD